ncbi:MAG: hypothetical protein HOP19_27605 [Acidobacteria bacterium]|nr:hypothetical protein [Acidobacteriota bacterium]
MPRVLSFSVSRYFKMTAAGIEIPCALEHNGIRIRAEAKVDPGSQYCLFQREIGEDLGLDVLSGRAAKLNTLAGDFTAYGHTITLHTLDLKFEAYVLFHQAYEAPRNILGCIGWLNNTHFALTMDDEMIHLKSLR